MEDIETLYGIIGVAVLIPILLFTIAILIIYLIGAVKLYQKAGKGGWEAIIPFYNKWVLVEISGLSWWWFLILIAPTIANIINKDLTGIAYLAVLFGKFCCFYNISKKLHKDVGTAVLSTIFPMIMIPVIGLSSNYKFDNSVPVNENGPFQTSNQSTTTNESTATPDKDAKFCSNCGKEGKKNAKYCMYCGKKLE